MIIRWASGLRSGFKLGLNRLRAGTEGWLAIALALSLLPEFLLAQIVPGAAASRPAATSTPPAAASAPTPIGGVSAPAGYILGPNDQVAVDVFDEPDLRTNGRLNPEGDLNVPLLGSIHLAGLTTTQAASRLTELYSRDYLVKPKINVTLLSYAKRHFVILGQVGHAGIIEMPESSPGGIDLLEAIAMAGGYTRIAAPERITVRRHNANGDQILKVNAKRLAKGKGVGFLVLGYLARTPKLYQGHTLLEVEFQEPSFVPTADYTTRTRSVFLASQEALKTIEQNLTNQTLLARVVRSEGLAQDGGHAVLGQSVVATKSSSATERTEPSQAGNKTQNASGVTTFTPLEEALARGMVGMVKPAIRRGTRLIDLYVTHSDPAMAQRLAEAVGREYIRNSIERRASSSEDALRYLLEEEERLKRNLQKSEAAATEYKAKNPDALQLGGSAAATGSQGAGAKGGLVEDNLQDINTKLTGARGDQIRLEGQLQQVDQLGNNIDALLAIPSIYAAPMVAAARSNIIQFEAGITTLALRYKDKHPRMMAAKASLAEAKVKLREAVLAQPAIMRNAIEQTKALEASLQQALQNQQGVAVNLNRTAIGYQELARQAETDRALYESVLRQIKDTNLAKDVKANAASVIEHSPIPNFPASPRPPKTILLGLLGGLAVGLTLVFGVDALDRSIKTVDQAESTLGLPVFAAVPDTTDEGPVSRLKRRSKAFRSSNYRIVVETPESPAAEAFRNLRAALSLLGPQAERKVSLFTSAVPNEGKSVTSANYSLALAQQGDRVLLIDGDLRRPNMHNIFS